MVEDVNATQKGLTLVVIVPTPRAFPIINKSIQAPLDIDDLMFNNTCGTSSCVVGEIAQTSFIEIWEGQVSGIRNGSQSCPLSIEEFLTTSNV